MATVDDVITRLGSFGRYQKWILLMCSLMSMYAAFTSMATIFTTAIPRHRCAVPGWPNDTYLPQGPAHLAAIADWVPMTSHNDSNVTTYDQCSLYVNGSGDGRVVACSQWVYDTSVFTSTVVSQFDVVCARKMARSWIRTTYMIGQFFGAFLFGYVADLKGRRLTLFISMFIKAVCSTVKAASPNIYVYCLFNLAVGVSGVGSYSSMFNLAMEMTGVSARFHMGSIVAYIFGVGWVLLVLLAYLLRDWQHLILAAMLPGVAFVSYWWFFPESPRWLIGKGRKQEAEVIIKKMAAVNNAKLTEDILRIDDDCVGMSRELKLWHLFRWRAVGLRFGVVVYNWIVNTLLFYGLALNAGSLAGDIYLNTFFLALMDILGGVICHAFINRVGRKYLYVTSMLIGGAACLATIFPVFYLSKDQQWVTTTLAMVGKVGATAAFGGIYIYTVELYPTCIRASCLGFASTCARVGSIAAPFVADLGLLIGGREGQLVPLLVFGGAAVTSGLLSLTLPETLNKPLPETLQDSHNLIRKSPTQNTPDAEMEKLAVAM